MIGLDTNVLVRYIVRDDDNQAEAATRLIESQCTAEAPGYICTMVLCELAWVLTRGYKLDRRAVGHIIRTILSVQELQVQDSEAAWLALKSFEKGKADFADYLIGASNRRNGSAVTYTFDKKAAESDLFRLVPES